MVSRVRETVFACTTRSTYSTVQYSTVQYSTVHHALHLAAASLPGLPPPPPVLPPPLLLQVAVVTVRVAAQHSAPAHITTAKNYLYLATTENIYNSKSAAKNVDMTGHRPIGAEIPGQGYWICTEQHKVSSYSNTLLYLSMSTLNIV